MSHETHCCKRHGCKYGDKDCPIVLGIAKQEYGCEYGSDFDQNCFELPPDPKIILQEEIRKNVYMYTVIDYSDKAKQGIINAMNRFAKEMIEYYD